MTKRSTYGQRSKSVFDRFHEKYSKTDGCWEWQSAFGSRGYGIFWHGKERRSLMAHRFALEVHLGFNFPSEQVVMHSCDNPKCVNPDHLSLGSIRDNALDAKSKGRLAIGERNGGGVKLTDEAVAAIKSRKGITSGQSEASLYGVSRTTVNAIRRNERWKHVSG